MRRLLLLVAPGAALAQGMMPPPGGGMGEQPRDVPEGPAEQAPEEEERAEAPELPGYPGQAAARAQLIELHGYFRLRGDVLHNFSLGLRPSQPGDVTIPFYTPLSEAVGDHGLDCESRRAQGADVDCPPKTLSGANMRLRLEPTLHVNDLVQVKSQIDVFDNLVLGSTPDGYYYGRGSPDGYTPILGFAGTQVPPEAGRNHNVDSIRVKRAWGEVRTPLGKLFFGRMPSQWGMGILANDGSCLDCDFGDNADRLMFGTELGGHKVALAHDWAYSGPSNVQHPSGPDVVAGPDRFRPVDLDQLDDMMQWVVVVGKIDRPHEFREKVERGEATLNYGSYFVWRKQDFDWEAIPEQGGGFERGAFRHREAYALIPDLWLKLAVRKLLVEFEGAYIFGNIGEAPVSTPPAEFKVRMWGFAARTTYRAVDDTLEVGMEVGAASGDDAEMLNLYQLGNGLNLQPPCPPDNEACVRTLSGFRFDPSYHVDLIFFREILGLVTNALYVKSHLQYDPIAEFGMRLDVIPSWALESRATPGDESFYGLELDASLMYRGIDARTGVTDFLAGLQGGVFLSAGALNHPAGLEVGGEPVWPVPSDAGVAWTLQGHLAIPF